jgi:hypothetical protein
MDFKRFVISIVCVAFLGMGTVVPAKAAMLGTQTYLHSVDRDANLAIVDAALLRDDVQQQLVGLGVDVEDARQRVANLPDGDLAKLANDIELMPAGGSSVLVVLGIILLVFIVLEVTGTVDVFSGT